MKGSDVRGRSRQGVKQTTVHRRKILEVLFTEATVSAVGLGSAAAPENSLAIPQNVKRNFTLGPRNPPPGCVWRSRPRQTHTQEK